jgi:hypothetical protein
VFVTFFKFILYLFVTYKKNYIHVVFVTFFKFILSLFVPYGFVLKIEGIFEKNSAQKC